MSLIPDSDISVQQPIAGAELHTQHDKNFELVSVQDFMTETELLAWQSMPTTSDMTRPLQAFFDAIKAKDYGTVYCSGVFAVSSGIIIGGSTSGSLTKNVVGNFTVNALNAIDTLVTIQAGSDFKWLGTITVQGTGSTSYSGRACRIGIKLGGDYGSARNVYTALVARRFSQLGISANNLTTLSNLGDVRASDCGSGRVATNVSLISDFNGRIDSGTSGSTGQLSTISVSILPPENLETQLFIRIGNDIHFVDSVDFANNKLSVFPWLDLTKIEGSLTYIFGAGVYTRGGDASVLRMIKIDAVRCGIAYFSTALYSAVVDNLVTQFCGIGAAFGSDPSAAHVGGQINGFYCEGNDFDLLRVSRAEMGVQIASQYAFNWDKVAYCSGPRSSSNEISYLASMKGFLVNDGGSLLSFEGYPRNNYLSTYNIDITSKNRSILSIYANSKNYALVAPTLSLNRAYGFERTMLIQFGSSFANNLAPSGASVFTAPAGYTVNGGTSVSFSGFTGAAMFSILLRYSANDFLVTCSNLAPTVLSASIVYDPSSLAAGAIQSTTVSLAGAKLGDIIVCSFNKSLSGTRMWAEVTAVDIVTVYQQNPTSAIVNVPSGTLLVKII